MEEQNEITDASIENQEEATARKWKGSSKTIDKRRRTSSSVDSASGDEGIESDSKSENDSSNSGSSETAPNKCQKLIEARGRCRHWHIDPYES